MDSGERSAVLSLFKISRKPLCIDPAALPFWPSLPLFHQYCLPLFPSGPRCLSSLSLVLVPSPGYLSFPGLRYPSFPTGFLSLPRYLFTPETVTSLSAFHAIVLAIGLWFWLYLIIYILQMLIYPPLIQFLQVLPTMAPQQYVLHQKPQPIALQQL